MICPEDGGSTVLLHVGMPCQTALYHKPEDHNVNFPNCKIPKSHYPRICNYIDDIHLLIKSMYLLQEPHMALYSLQVPYVLESNPHPFYSFRELKNQMRIRIACGLDSRSRAGFWKNDRAAVRAVRTVQ